MTANGRKSILLLGGSRSQLVAIKRASELGYRTVLCDYLSDNPGRELVDSFHLVSTTDRDAVLRVAIDEGVEGVVAYGSDPAAPTAAFVAKELGLSGVPLDTAISFCDKHLFRGFLEKHGFHVPRSIRVSASDGFGDSLPLTFPVIVKPVDSSGSKGVTVVSEHGALRHAVTYALGKSRSGKAIIEEFIERDHAHVIEAEVFAVGGKVASWGLMNSIRDNAANPLLPAGYSMPLQLSEKRKKLVRDEVSRLVYVSGVTNGAFNIEMIIDEADRLFFLDAGPRNGGNMLPEFVGMASGKDLVAATLRAAMGQFDGCDVTFDGTPEGCWGLGVLHSCESGSFGGVTYSDAARTALVREEIDVSEGGCVTSFEECGDLVGLAFFRFDCEDAMREVMEHPEASMRVALGHKVVSNG